MLISNRCQPLLMVGFVMLLCLIVTGGCQRYQAEQTSVAENENAINARKVAELERKLNTQTARLNQLVNGIQDSITGWTAGSAGMTTPSSPGMFRAGSYDTLMKEEVYFDANEFRLDQEDRDALDRLARQMASYPTSILQITGHCDKTGSAFYNQQLSRQRSDAALRYLVDKYDIPLYRMESLGYGTEKPKYLDDTGSQMNKNRRIEIRLMLWSDSPIP